MVSASRIMYDLPICRAPSMTSITLFKQNIKTKTTLFKNESKKICTIVAIKSLVEKFFRNFIEPQFFYRKWKGSWNALVSTDTGIDAKEAFRL